MFGCRIDNRRYYDLLRVPRDATADETRRAYRRAAITHHPDKFKEVAHAYQVLSDPDQRAGYDEHGEDGIKEGKGGGGGGYAEAFGEVMATFTHVSAGEAHAGGGFRAGTVMHRLSVSLENLYNGATKRFSLSRNVICYKCNGKGSKPGAPTTCTTCGGAGYKLMGTFRRRASERCAACNGSGEYVPYQLDRCSACNGTKVVPDRRQVLEVVIEKGMADGDNIVFTALADEENNSWSCQVVEHDVLIVRVK